MATANVAAVYNGTVPYDLAVVACNLSTDISIKDFGIVNTTDNGLESNTLWTKVSPTLIRYTGGSASLNSGDSILIRRKTPNVVVQTVSYAARFSSDLWNSELDRIIRWREEADLNGVGALSTGVDFSVSNEAFGVTWDNDFGRPPSRNSVYDYVVTLAALASPAFSGLPTCATAAPGSNNTVIANTNFVTTADNLKAPLVSPAFSGSPSVPSLSLGTNNTVIANTNFVAAAVAPLAPIASPTFTGVPAAPTAAALTNTTQLATTAFVQAASAGNLALKADIASPTFTGSPAVPSVAFGTNNTVIANTNFVAAAVAGLAPLAAPAFSGLPTSATAAAGSNNTVIANTNFVTNAISTAIAPLAVTASPTFTGAPAAPTQAPGTNTTVLANTNFVTSAIATAVAPLASNASPTFTGSPAAPTQAPGTNTTVLANTNFVTTADNLKANIASPTFTGIAAVPLAATATNTAQIASTNFVQQELISAEVGTHPFNNFATDLYKNSVMNGRFHVWQRGFTYSYASIGTPIDDKRVTADRWVSQSYNTAGSSHAFTISRQEHTPGQTLVPNNPKYYYRYNLTALGAPSTAHVVRMYHNIEGVTFLQNKLVTISFYARSSIASKVLGVRLIRNMGTGGSAPYEPVTTTFTLTSSFALYTHTFLFTSLTGATMGTEGTDNYFFTFIYGTGSAELPASIASSVGTTDISDVQMEVGSRATRINDKGFGLELLDCMRYYQQSYGYGVAPGTTINAGGTHFEGSWVGGTGTFQRTTRLHTRMNKQPSITLYDNIGNAGFVFKGTAGKVGLVSTISDDAFYAGTTDATASPVLFYHWTATTES